MDISFRSVVHPTDFSDLSFAAFAHALRIALATKSHLYVLHVAENAGETSRFPDVVRLLVQWRFLAEDDAPSAISTKLGVSLENVRLRRQNPRNAIVHFLNQHRCDLVVLATHGRDGVDHWLKGSIAEAVFNRAAISTLFVPHGARGFIDEVSGDFMLRRALVPIHRTPVPYRAIEAAKSFPRLLTGKEIETRLLHVVGLVPAFKDAKMPIMMRHGDVVQTILDAAVEFDVDFMCMPTAGHHGIFDALRGGTTERVLRHAPCPVLAIPAV